ncbi:hypothetical protein MYX06_05070 [Patescibacteria group bacterium AH-259-L05]|nr:hypothetical protein [Patescibacteria group bacterium AH-259-L05]
MVSPNKWEQLVFLAEEKFGIDNQFSEDFVVSENSRGEKVMGKREAVEFEGPLGKMRLEKITRPRVIDKKVLSRKRIGSGVTVDYIYSDDDPVVELKIYRNRAPQNPVTRSAHNKNREDGEWEEVSPESMGIS